MIIFVGGLVGVGKSSIAANLAERLSIPYYAVDEIKKVIYPEDPDFERNIKYGIPFKKETRMKVYGRAVSDLRLLSEKHKHMVVDESLHLRDLRQVLFDAANVYFGGYVIVWVKADEKLILERLETKDRKGHILTDPIKMYRSFAKEFEDFNESHVVCNNCGSVDDAVEKMLSLFRQIAAMKM